MKKEDLVKLINLEIDGYEEKRDFKNIGHVLQSGDGIAQIYGLSDVMAGELITFDKKTVYGMALNLEEDSVGVILFGDIFAIVEGDRAYSSGELLKVPVGDELLGRVISPLGEVLDGGTELKRKSSLEIYRDSQPMFKRVRVSEPLETGIKAIDGLIPIGKGQRELIIGDRHTGKSSIAIDTVINQKDKEVTSIYVVIGQKMSAVAKLLKRLKDNNVKNFVIVSATASDSASLQYVAPYAGSSIAEHFMEKGKDVLIVYDDLTKHAVAYRELSLLLKRSPGREAYPGDIFYIHSQLLERAAVLAKGGSLTALPIVETVSGDLSSYVPTNIISITDGQIYLESKLFNSNIRPSINQGLSVSRVGGDAQLPLMKRVSSSIKIAIAQYEEVASFAKFSSDMDTTTKRQIEKGEKIVELLKQDRSSVDVVTQIVLFYAVGNGNIDNIELKDISEYEKSVALLVKKSKSFRDKIFKAKEVSEVKKDLDKILEQI